MSLSTLETLAENQKLVAENWQAYLVCVTYNLTPRYPINRAIEANCSLDATS